MSNWNLEVSAELAENAESFLREFGQDAELDLALLVDESGAMIAGVASRQDIDVATVGVMVATTYSSVRSLSKALGDTETGDCIIHGSDNHIYLCAVVERFMLLGVSETSLPIGVIREKAAQVTVQLQQILGGLAATAPAPAQPSAPTPQPEPPSGGVSMQVPGAQIASPATNAPAQPAPPADQPPAVSTEEDDSGGPKYVFEIG